jgi:hypothetical protein
VNGEPLDHVARPSLPWRDDAITECGLSDMSAARVLSRAAFEDKVKRQGKTRSALTTCMTCWQTASRWKDWSQAPSEVLRRELPSWSASRQPHPRIDAELRAIAALIAAHREEFDDFLTGLALTSDLETRRAMRRRRIVGDRA